MPGVIGPLVGLFTAIGHGFAAAAPALGGIGSAVGIGKTISDIAGGGGSGQPQQDPGLAAPAAPAAPAPAAPVPSASDNIATETANRMREAMLARKQQPGLQESGGGGLSPDYTAQMARILSGTFGSNPSTTNPGSGYLGFSGGSGTGGSGSGSSLLDSISQLGA